MRRMYSLEQLKEVVKNTKGYDFANLVDKDGHDRFIEGDITMEAIEGITQSYGKWSLSGSHLLIVLAGTIANATSLTGDTWALVNLPEWIKDKLVPLFNNRVEFKQTSLFADDQTTQSCSYGLIKDADAITIRYLSNTTLTATRMFRFQFDLLIDND